MVCSSFRAKAILLPDLKKEIPPLIVVSSPEPVDMSILSSPTHQSLIDAFHMPIADPPNVVVSEPTAELSVGTFDNPS
jgi:hypothetical protein